MVWFAGIPLVSYLGSYSGATNTKAGQADVYGFDGGLVANAILTIVTLACAWYCQLPPHRVEEILNEPEEGVAPPAMAAPAD